MKATADVVEDAARGHLVERVLDHPERIDIQVRVIGASVRATADADLLEITAEMTRKLRARNSGRSAAAET